MLNFVFTLLSSVVVIFVTQVLLGLHLEWNWLDEALRAAGNAAIGLVIFPCWTGRADRVDPRSSFPVSNYVASLRKFATFRDPARLLRPGLTRRFSATVPDRTLDGVWSRQHNCGHATGAAR